MTTDSVRFTGDLPTQRYHALLSTLLAGVPLRAFCVRLWDGSCWRPDGASSPVCTLVLKHPGSLRAMFLRPNMLSLAEAYLFDEFDIEGDFEQAIRLGEYLLGQRMPMWQRAQCFFELLRIPTRQSRPEVMGQARLDGRNMSRNRVKRAIRYHYDLPTEFFTLWLDKRLVYSGAYFHTPDDTIDDAQIQKLDHICNKLDLQPSERLADLGCGWGALVVHAAARNQVNCHGVTVSEQQSQYAKELVAEQQLEDRCHIELSDFRDVAGEEAFDKVVSIGMAEHVLSRYLCDYYGTAMRLLKPGGLFLSQCIASSVWKPLRKGASFMQRYIFPDTELVPLNVTLRAAERAGLEVRDVENLREHYALTLRRWLAGLEKHRDKVIAVTDEITYRKYRLYLAACAHDFASGRLNLFQVLYSKPNDGISRLPLTRDQWYSRSTP